MIVAYLFVQGTLQFKIQEYKVSIYALIFENGF